MSTKQKLKDDISIFFEDYEKTDDKLVIALSEAELALAKEKDERGEERFILWIFIILLLDILLIKNAHWILISFLCLVQFIVFLCLAERWRVEKFIRWTDWLKNAAQNIYKNK